MSVVAQVLLGLGIVAAGIGLFVLIGEVSLWWSMRHFRDYSAEDQRWLRRRLRRAFYQGAASIGQLPPGRRRR